MPLTGPKEMFARAYKEGYAVGAFNVNNMEIVQGIVAAGAEEKAPLILQVSAGARKYAGQAYIVKLIEAALQESDLPIVLHLDHGGDFQICKDCIDGGFTSVMFDGSHLPYEENIAITRQVVEYARPRGVWVEAELGRLAGVEDEVSAEKSIYTDPEQAADFVRRSGCDSLAVATGLTNSPARPSWTLTAWKKSAGFSPASLWCCMALPACRRSSWSWPTSTAAKWAGPKACPKTCCVKPPAWLCAKSILIRIYVWP